MARCYGIEVIANRQQAGAGLFFDKRNIEFILEERGVGAGAAGTNVPLVDHYDVESFFGEAVRDECPSDSCTHDDNIALEILLKCWINAQQAILQGPEGSRRNQIHALHWLRQDRAR